MSKSLYLNFTRKYTRFLLETIKTEFFRSFCVLLTALPLLTPAYNPCTLRLLGKSALKNGITLWRLLSGQPCFKLVEDQALEMKKVEQ